MLVTLPLPAGQSPLAVDDDAAARAGPEITRIVTETTKKLAKTELHAILTTPLRGCLAAPQLCNEFDAELRANLGKSIPGAQFINREEAMKYLQQGGYLIVDAYMGALGGVASHAGADAVIGEDFSEERNKCKLRTTLVDSRHRYQLEDSETPIPCSAGQTRTKMTALKDTSTGAFLIAVVPQSAAPSPLPMPVQFPSCVRCPNPHYSGFARERGVQGSVRVLLTISEQGVPQNVKILGGVEESLERVTIEALRDWQFKPALDGNGKPFPIRTEIVVTFRMGS